MYLQILRCEYRVRQLNNETVLTGSIVYYILIWTAVVSFKEDPSCSYAEELPEVILV
jgi:hypothetical protein